MDIVVNDLGQELSQCEQLETSPVQYTYHEDAGTNAFADLSGRDHVVENESTKTTPRCLLLLDSLFSSHKLNPVNPAAQSMVPLPEGLDLEQPIVFASMKSTTEEPDEWSSLLKIGKSSQQHPPGVEVDGYGRLVGMSSSYSYVEDNDNVLPSIIKTTRGKSAKGSKKKKKTNKEDGEEGKDVSSRSKSKKKSKKQDDVDDIPIVQLNIDDLGSEFSF